MFAPDRIEAPPGPLPLRTVPAPASAAVLAEWLECLAEFKARCVLVLGPDAQNAHDSREVVAIHPCDFLGEALALAASSSWGTTWRASHSPLVAWKNLEAGGGETGWTQAWRRRGVHALVRVDMPMPFGNGFECFMFAGRALGDRNEAAAMAWTAMSIWPALREETIAPRFEISRREREVLLALGQGLTSKEAAGRLGCTERTVGFHLTNAAMKLNAPNRAATIQRACALGLL